MIGIGAYAEFDVPSPRELRESEGYVDGIEEEYAGTEETAHRDEQ